MSVEGQVSAALIKGWDESWRYPWGEVVLLCGSLGEGPKVQARVGERVIASWAWAKGSREASLEAVVGAIDEAARCGQRVADYVPPPAGEDTVSAEEEAAEE